MKDMLLVDLKKFMFEHLRSDEIMGLCFTYFVDIYEELDGSGFKKSERIHEILTHLYRTRRLHHLVGALTKEFPELMQEDFPNGFNFNVVPFAREESDERNPKQVFISYARKDAEFAYRLAGDLEIRGWKVWIAPDSILVGEQWVDAIERGLATSSAFLLVMSPSAINSKWVRRETNSAIQLEMEGQIIILPLLKEACDVPNVWRTYHYISFTRNPYPIDEVIDRLKQLTNHSSIAEGLPKILAHPDYREVFFNQIQEDSWDSAKQQLELMVLDITQPPLVRVRSVEILLELTNGVADWDMILAQPESIFIRHIIELLSEHPEIVLSKTQAETLLQRNDLPRHGNCVAVPIKNSIQRGANYTSKIFNIARTQKPWEIRLDCITRIIEIDDEDALLSLQSFLQNTTYWVARIRIVKYIDQLLQAGRLNETKLLVACNILEEILSDGNTSRNSKTGSLAVEVQQKIGCSETMS